MSEVAAPRAYRAWLVDLDGTLLLGDHTPAPEGARALAEATRRGIRVVIASARNPYSACRFARQIGLTDPLVCSNGAQVWASPAPTASTTWSTKLSTAKKRRKSSLSARLR